MQIAKGVPSLKGSILCVSGGGAFKFKEEKKNHGVLSEMMEAFGEQKGCRKKDKATMMVKLNQEPPHHPTVHWKPFMTYLWMTPTI